MTNDGELNFRQWDDFLGRDSRTRIILRREAFAAVGEGGDCARDGAEWGFYRGRAAGERHSFDGGAAQAEGGGFAEDDVRQRVGVGGVALDGEQHAGALLFHRDRRGRHVEGAGLPQSFDRVADRFARGIVEVSFQHHDRIAACRLSGFSDQQPQ